MPNRRNVMRTSLGVLAATQLGAGGATAADAPVAATGHGKVRGGDDGGIKVFKGIPYATAGRFEAPVAPQPWADVRDAVAFGPMCPQARGPLGSLFASWTFDKEMSEDCLVLNVWTPGLRDGTQAAGDGVAARRRLHLGVGLAQRVRRHAAWPEGRRRRRDRQPPAERCSATSTSAQSRRRDFADVRQRRHARHRRRR